MTPPVVTEHTIAQVVSEWSGIPIGKLESSEMDRLIALEDKITKCIKGQAHSIRGVACAICWVQSGLWDPHCPVASFLFCGPTGTGKTELCKTLAETYFGAERDMIRIDCSEYMEKHSVSRLTGPPPGYIGYESGGQLTEAVRKAPHSVVLLDEVEKAHGDVLNILLQIMEDGILTDGKGRTVNFKNTILVMTSNVGSKRILELVRSEEADAAANGVSPKVSTTLVNGSRARSSVTASPQQLQPQPQQVPPEPMKPEDILKRMQNSPQASALLMRASSDPEIMGAIRTAMNGSPVDLLKLAQQNPTVSEFLQDLWSAMGDGAGGANGDSTNSGTTVPARTNGASPSSSSGLNAIRSSFQDTVSQWNDSASNQLASGLIDQPDVPNGLQQQPHTKEDDDLYP